MLIRVRLFGALGLANPALGSPTGASVEVAEGATVKDLFLSLGLDPQEVGLVTQGAERLSPESPLGADGMVSIFSPVFGG